MATSSSLPVGEEEALSTAKCTCPIDAECDGTEVKELKCERQDDPNEEDMTFL